MECERCWDKPCTCGFMYRHETKESIDRLIAALQRVKRINAEHPEFLGDRLGARDAYKAELTALEAKDMMP